MSPTAYACVQVCVCKYKKRINDVEYELGIATVERAIQMKSVDYREW
jgi:hypothetical protein